MRDQVAHNQGAALGRRDVLAALAGSLFAGGWAPRAFARDDEPTIVESRRFKGHTDFVWGVALSPDGKTLVTGGGDADHTAKSWSYTTGQEQHKIDVVGGAMSCVMPDNRRSFI